MAADQTQIDKIAEALTVAFRNCTSIAERRRLNDVLYAVDDASAQSIKMGEAFVAMRDARDRLGG
jgi:hypothetical protein